MLKISVIVPIYNVEKYLDRCVESIVNQTYKNLEIILVDDGSPDNCPKMCDEWAKKDDRIKVVHKTNGGVSSARNAGLDIATGDYVTFIDADDFILSDFSCLIDKKLEDDIICLPYYTKINKKYTLNKIIRYETNYTYYNFKHAILSNSTFNSVCFKIFKNELIKINNIRFDNNLIIAEDLKFCFECMKNSQNISILNLPYYVYDRRTDSVMGFIYFEKINHTLAVCKFGIKLMLNETNCEKIKIYKKIISENLLSVMKNIKNYKNNEKEYLINELILLKKYINYGSTFFKKLVVIFTKLFGVKFTIYCLKFV